MNSVLLEGDVSSVRQWPSADRMLELAFIGVLATGGLGLLAALLGIFSAPQVWLFGLLLTGFYGVATRHKPLHQNIYMRWVHVGLLVVITLFFRLPAFHYVLGGQDEGVYVNVANYIERTGQVSVTDDIVGKLRETPTLSRYLKSNRLPGGGYLAGIYGRNTDPSTLEFQFYHLFPVWMALVSGVFGIASGVYALTLFALLSVLFTYRLVLSVTGQYQAALWAASLLALSPLHAFFSKFPVTEVPTLAYSLAGFCYISSYWRSAPAQRRGRLLAITFAAFASLFFIRISGFMYVPFLVALGCLSALRDEDSQRRSAVQWLMLAIVLAYGLSVIYGLLWSHSYAVDIYGLVFGGVIGPSWPLYVAIVCMLGLLFWLGCTLLPNASVWRARIGKLLIDLPRMLLGLVVLAAVAVSVLKIYWLGWTQHYASDSWLSGYWNLGGSGWRAAKASSFAQLGVYAGPLLLVVGLVLLCQRQRDPVSEFMRLFTAGFMTYALILQWNVPYGPYYARYLLSEALPYLVIFVVCAWAAWKQGHVRRLLTAILIISLVYAGVLSAGQLGKQENDGLYDALGELVAHVDHSDVILLDSMGAGLPNTSEIKTPLVFTFGKQVVTVSDADLSDSAYLETIGQRFDDTYLISPKPDAPPAFEEVDSVRVKVWAFKPGHGPPLQLVMRENMWLHLFRKVRSQLPPGVTQGFQSGSDWAGWLDGGWSTPESWGVWTTGRVASLAIDTRELPVSATGLRLHFAAQVYVVPKYPRQRVQVDIEGGDTQMLVATYPNSRLSFYLSVSAEQLQSGGKLHVHFKLPDAVSPQSLGVSGDTRLLSVGLVSIQADLLPPVPAGSAPADVRPASRRARVGELKGTDTP
jgi:hypothetical protein